MKKELQRMLERFQHFNDSVLTSINLYFRENGEKSLEIRINAQDWTGRGDAWRAVTLRIEQVDSYRLEEEPKTTMQVLSNGLHVVMADGRVGVELGDLVDPPASLAALAESRCHVIGSDLVIVAEGISGQGD